jgi:DNA-binding transcriptional LysR family regulator
MDLHRLRVLLELCRLGSMNAVAESMHTSTSTVSQQIATLAREVGTPLVEPVGRRVRLTPAGKRLADHAVTILAAVDAARLDLDPDAEPTGAVRVAGFATAIRRTLLPAVADLVVSHPGVEVRIHEYEPLEALDLITADDVDLALVYDYNLSPLSVNDEVLVRPLWEVPWGLGVPAAGRRTRKAADVPVDLSEYADSDWIVNSRNTADEEVVRTLASLVGFTPRVVHRIDSLELVEELIDAGRGVGVLPLDYPATRRVRVLPLADPGAALRAFAVVRRGREAWPPLRLVLERLACDGPGTWA